MIAVNVGVGFASGHNCFRFFFRFGLDTMLHTNLLVNIFYFTMHLSRTKGT